VTSTLDKWVLISWRRYLRRHATKFWGPIRGHENPYLLGYGHAVNAQASKFSQIRNAHDKRCNNNINIGNVL